MATAKLLRVLVTLIIAAFISLPAALVTRAEDEAPVVDHEASVSSEAEVSCCSQGYECTPIDPDASHEDDFEDDDGPACHGIVTCTFFVGGQIIALPFRLLNAVFKIVI
ncbi:MAG: hypothetical protein ABGX04_14775 [Myxococcales bacterium]|nr:hypothetical protein [Myxococcales bacterium]